MYNCVWTIDIVFGKQKEALEIIKAWELKNLSLPILKLPLTD